MAWIYLIIAGIFEVIWAVGMKYCDGFKVNLPLIAVIIGMVFSVTFLYLAMKQIPIGTAYAIWTGIGIIGVVLYGIFVLGEPASLLRVIFLVIILAGIVGLKLSSES